MKITPWQTKNVRVQVRQRMNHSVSTFNYELCRFSTLRHQGKGKRAALLIAMILTLT